MLQTIYESDVSTNVEHLHTDVNQIKYAVEKFDKIFEYEFDTLAKVNKHIDGNEEVLNRCIGEAHEVTRTANAVKEINTDEMICAETVVHNQ